MKRLNRSIESRLCLFLSMAIGLSFLGVFCMWLMWLCVYMHQMNPLIMPILDREVVHLLKESQGVSH